MSSTDKPSTVAVGCLVKIKDPDIGEETISSGRQGKGTPGTRKILTGESVRPIAAGCKARANGELRHAPEGRVEVEVLDFDWDS